MPHDALVVLGLTLTTLVVLFMQDDKKPAHGCTREQATRETNPTTK